METNNSDNSKEPINDDVKFENSDVDPGFSGHQEDTKEMKGREDKREHNIDANMSIKEMREGKKDDGDAEDSDAMNYKNDRENGSYNPKNI